MRSLISQFGDNSGENNTTNHISATHFGVRERDLAQPDDLISDACRRRRVDREPREIPPGLIHGHDSET